MTVCELPNFKQKCSGCFSCFNACPVGAIEMSLDNEGFYFPSISEDKCVKCGICRNVCAMDKEECHPIDDKTSIYLIQAPDDIRRLSSSGGFFFLLSKYILDKGGVVYGAAFDCESQEIKHKSTDQVTLEEICRSKYVQSNINVTYKEIKEHLKTGRMVLFGGTPCQVHALKKYLGNGYLNLITVDFVCHGVPSTSFFNDMLKSLEKQHNARIVNVTFREKDCGWRKQLIKFYYDNGFVESFLSANYYYYFLFLNNYTIRQSCFTCCYPNNHVSDVIIWDAWNFKEDDKGTSAVAILSETGKEVFSAIKTNMNVVGNLKLSDFNMCFSGHSTMKTYKRSVICRKRFFSYYTKNGFEKTIQKWYPRNLRSSKIKSAIRSMGAIIKRVIKL